MHRATPREHVAARDVIDPALSTTTSRTDPAMASVPSLATPSSTVHLDSGPDFVHHGGTQAFLKSSKPRHHGVAWSHAKPFPA